MVIHRVTMVGAVTSALLLLMVVSVSEAAEGDFIAVFESPDSILEETFDFSQSDQLLSFTKEFQDDNRDRSNGDIKQRVIQIGDFMAFLVTPKPGVNQSQMEAHPGVKYVDADRPVELEQVSGQCTAEQNTATDGYWHLDHVDGAAQHDDIYKHNPQHGNNVRAYVIDTGVNTDHVDFTTPSQRFDTGYCAKTPCNTIPPWKDVEGHGSHVAGIFMGTYSGVAKGATLVPVRFTDDSGSGGWTEVIACLQWVYNDWKAHPGTKAVINMSLGSQSNLPSVNAAVNSSITQGMIVSTSAGNKAADACNHSPGGLSNSISVGSLDEDGTVSSFSNYGTCVHVYAPGGDVVSSCHTSNTNLCTKSGTSMASPVVAGIAAVLVSIDPTLTHDTVRNTIIDMAAKIVQEPVTNVPGRPSAQRPCVETPTAPPPTKPPPPQPTSVNDKSSVSTM